MFSYFLFSHNLADMGSITIYTGSSRLKNAQAKNTSLILVNPLAGVEINIYLVYMFESYLAAGLLYSQVGYIRSGL